MASLQQRADLLSALFAATAPRRLNAWQDDLVDVQKGVLLKPDVDECRFEPVDHVVDLALVDIADDRAAAPPFDVQLGHAVAGRWVCFLRRALVALRSWSSCLFEQRNAGFPRVNAD